MKMVVGQSAEQQARFLREVRLMSSESGPGMHVLGWRHVPKQRGLLHFAQGWQWGVCAPYGI